MRATGRDESQSVPSPEKLFKTRDLELPFFEGSLPSCSPHSLGYTRTSLHPYFPEGPTIKIIWSRSKFPISIEIFDLARKFQSRRLEFPTKNRAAVGGSLENFILARNFQSRSKSRIFLIFGPSGFPVAKKRKAQRIRGKFRSSFREKLNRGVRGRVNREVQTVNWEAGKEGGCRDRCQERPEKQKAHKPWIRRKKRRTNRELGRGYTVKCKPWIRHFQPRKFQCFSSQFALHGLCALEGFPNPGVSHFFRERSRLCRGPFRDCSS